MLVTPGIGAVYQQESGHYYWTGGVVLRSKLPKLIEKMAAFRIDRDAPGRAYGKSKGLASTHLVILDSPDDVLPWVLVSTQGRGGLADATAPSLGTVRDTRLGGQHLVWKRYELLHAEKRMTRTRDVLTKDGKVLKGRQESLRQTTWSWRLLPERVRAHEALIVALVKQRDSAGLNVELAALAQMPLFAGVRGQVLKLYAEAKKLASKFSLAPPVTPDLPYMVKLSVYSDPPVTLLALAEI